MAVTRVLVARHAAAEYENDLLTDDGGSLTVAGRAQAMELGDNLEGEGIVHVWTSPLARAVQTAELAATALVCGVTVREGLREFGVGAHVGQPLTPDPLGPTFLKWLDGDLDARIEGGESGTEIAARVAAVLNEVAAAHPGGTVLVLSHGGSMGVGLPALAGNLEQDFPKDHPRPQLRCGRARARRRRRWRRLARGPVGRHRCDGLRRRRLGKACLIPAKVPLVSKHGKKKAKGKLPKSKCCVSKSRCKRCPIRMLKEGTLPDGLTVKKRQLVTVERQEGHQEEAGQGGLRPACPWVKRRDHS